MRQVVEPGERRAALEVDQYVVELFRAVRHGQAEHERAEELGLAGAGGADAQAVRTHAAHRGLLDVQLDGMAVLGRADGDTKALVERTRSPRLPYVERERVAHAEHRRVVLGRLDDELGGVIVVAAGEDRHAVRAQLAGEHLGVDHRYEIGLAERCGRDLAGLYAPVQRHLVRRDVEHGDPLLDPAWPLPLAGDVDRARRRRRRREHVGADPVHAVDHDDHVDRVAPGDALAAVGHLRQLERGPGEEPYGTGAVRTCRVLYVRQPLDPVPVLGVLRRRHDHQPHFARRVPGHDLSDHRVREPSRGVEVADQLEPAEAAEVDLQRDRRDGQVRTDETTQRARRERFEVLDRLRLRRHDPLRELLPADRDPDREEVVRVGAALPHPTRSRERPQRVGRGVAPHHRAALVGGRLAHLAPCLAEVAEVVAAARVQLLRLVVVAAAHLADHHADHRDPHEATREGPEARLGAAAAEHPGVHEAHRRDARDHGQEAQHGAERLLRCGGRDLGRGLEQQVAPGHGWWRRPLAAGEDDRCHQGPVREGADAIMPQCGAARLGPQVRSQVSRRIVTEPLAYRQNGHRHCD